MKKKKVLLMYITPNSGHHRAALALEKAIKVISPNTEVMNINSFNYTNPVLEKIITKTYMGVIKTTPEVWDYLYNNPKVVSRTQFLRDMIHKYNSGKFKTLLEEFSPDVAVCTQAFPCGLVADYKKTTETNLTLVGILTDYAPHSYWIYDEVNYYIVPSNQAKERLVNSGILPDRIKEFGIPVDPVFKERLNREEVHKKVGLSVYVPTILIMGGSQGMGPIKKIIKVLDRSNQVFQLMVVCGVNKSLCHWLNRHQKRFKKKVVVFEYASNIDELMEIAGLIITKPGGLTTAEALIKGLPMIIIKPIPGQEANNTDFLLMEKVALKANDEEEVMILVEELLANPVKLEQMRWASRRHSQPEAAFDTAELILEI